MSMTESTSGAQPEVKVRFSFLKLMAGSDLSIRRLPLMTAESAIPGPLVWLTACSHGDEVSGIVVIQEIFRHLNSRLLRGTVKAFPLMNPVGFETRQRFLSISREDLNRSYPGNPVGSLGERIAHLILTTVSEDHPDLVLDLHSDWIESMPYCLFDHDPGEMHQDVYNRTLDLGRKSGLCMIVDDDELTSSLTYNLLLQNIPSMTFELGKAHVVSERHVRYGVEAIWNILASMDMIAPRKEPFAFPLPEGFGSGKLLKYSDKPYGSKVGIIRFLAKPGDVVTTGQPLAKIVSVFGKHEETILAKRKGIVLGHSDSSAAFPGMPIMAFGQPDADLE